MTTKEKTAVGTLLLMVAAIFTLALLPAAHAVFGQAISALLGLLGLHHGADIANQKLDAGAPPVPALDPVPPPVVAPKPPTPTQQPPQVEPAPAPTILTPQQVLQAIMPRAHPAAVATHASLCFAAMLEADISTPARQAMFLANCALECDELRELVEEWGPSAAQLRYEPPSHVATELGNTEPGDGQRYLGRGVVQLTGRGNYYRAGHSLGLDLEGNPEVAALPDVVWRTACWYWNTKALSAAADAGDFEATVKGINGGLTDLAQRQAYLARAQKVLGA